MSVSTSGPAELYRSSLPPGHLEAFAIDPFDRFGVPVWTASWWPADPAEGGPLHGSGYGRTPDDAMIGAFGELAESVAVSAALDRLPRTTGSYSEQVARLGPGGVVDPVSVCLPAGTAYTPGTVIDWVSARRWPSGEEVLVPVELAASAPSEAGRFEDDLLFTPITNGLGAGDTVERAIAHGVLELLQRDGNSVAYRALDAGVRVRPDGIEDPATRGLLAELDAAGLEVLIKLAATDFDMANVYVVGWDRDENAPFAPMATSCGEAVHPDREVALRKALHEYLSSRARKALSHGPRELVAEVVPPGYLERLAPLPPRGEERAYRAMQRWLAMGYSDLRALLSPTFHAVREEVAFRDLPTTHDPGDPAPLLDLLTQRLEEASLPVLYVPLAEPGDPVQVVKAIVPGLEVETATYHRIGPRNLARLVQRPDALAGTGPAPKGALPVALTPPARQHFGADAWLDARRLDALVEPVYPLYREPDRHAVWRG